MVVIANPFDGKMPINSVVGPWVHFLFSSDTPSIERESNSLEEPK